MQKFKSLQELFEDEKRWTKGESARDANCSWVMPHSPFAVCWCISGAIRLVYDDSPNCQEIETRITRLCGGSMVNWNDDPARTIDDVRRLVKEAGV